MTTTDSDSDDQKARSKWFQLDRQMIPSKLCYFFTGGFVGSIDPYFNLFFLSIGLTYAQAGWISGISFAISSISGPLFGSLADKTGRRCLIYIILCLGTACFVYPLPFVAEYIGTDRHVKSYENDTHKNAAWPKGHKPRSSVLHFTTLFDAILVLTIASRFFFMALPSYVEGTVMNVVNNRGTSYGTQKLFSCAGYSCFNLISGVVNTKFRLPGYSKYAPGFFVFLFCILALLPSGIILLGQSRWDDEEKNSNDNEDVANVREDKLGIKQIISKFVLVCRRMDTIMFFVTVFMSGFALTILQGFGFVLMRNYMHGTTIGMTVLVQILVGSVMLFYRISSKMIDFLGGPFPAMILSLFSYFPRYILMSYISNQWIVIAINSVHGLGLGIHWVAQMAYTNKIFPTEIKMTSINIVCTLHSVVCGSIANALGGTIYNSIGGLWLLRGTGVLCGVWAVIVAIYYKTIRQEVSDVSEERNSTETIVDVI